MLVLAVITVFVAGLMVGRTPEYLGKKIGAREIKLASLYFLTTPALVLARHRRRDGDRTGPGVDAQPGPHGLSRGALRVHLGRQQQRLGLRRAQRQHRLLQHALGVAMLLGRFLPDRASCWRWPARWPQQGTSPATAGTLPTHRPQFVGCSSSASSLIVAGLTFFPPSRSGPLAEGLS